MGRVSSDVRTIVTKGMHGFWSQEITVNFTQHGIAGVASEMDVMDQRLPLASYETHGLS